MLVCRNMTALLAHLRGLELDGQTTWGLVDAARPHLADLREATRNTVHLAVLEGIEVVYVNILRGPDAPRLPSRVGGRLPAHATGVGKAMVAFAADDAVDRVIATGLPRMSRRTITSPAILRRQLARIRDEATAYEREESGIGTGVRGQPDSERDRARDRRDLNLRVGQPDARRAPRAGGPRDGADAVQDLALSVPTRLMSAERAACSSR